jgi:hypothetical protein
VTTARARIFALAVTALVLSRASAARAEDGALQIVADDGRTWDAIVREVESDPRTVDHTYLLAVTTWGARLGCDDFRLDLDDVAARAFALAPCDAATRTVAVRVAAREALFDLTGPVPRPRAASIRVTRVERVTARGGGGDATAGSRVGCSVWLQPYVWDGLRGHAVGLPPDRYELRPLDARVHAAPDGAGWIAHGESQMDVTFRYEIVDRATGARVTENVATLACRDAPVASASSTDAASAIPTDASTSPDAVASAANARRYAIDASYGTSTVFGGGRVDVEVAALRLGAGLRVSDRVYLGGSARGAFVTSTGEPASGTSLQLAPEVRISLRAPRSEGGWVGLRAGLERTTTRGDGTFAEAAWGPELHIDNVQLGLVLALGAMRTAPAAPRDAQTGTYASLAFRVGVDL